MNIYLRRVTRCPLLVGVTTASLFAITHLGAESTQQAAETVEVEILHQKIIQQGGRTVTYNIVAPTPELLAARPPAEQTIEAVLLSQEQLQALQSQEPPPKPVKSFIIEGTTYANGITEFRWGDAEGQHRAFSNVDFTLFSVMTMLEGADSIYQFTFLVSRSTSALPPGVPEASEFSSSQAGYMAVAGQETSSPIQEAAVFAPFDALHVYYDNAKTELLASRTASLAAQAAREQELRDHPPQPQDVTHNFWPIKSTLRPTE